MQAAVVNVPGQAPKYQTFPDPVAEEGEALIRVRAAGLHPVVKGISSGTHYASGGAGQGPTVPGIDGVGVLDDGSRVYFGLVRKPWGTMAELAAAPRRICIPIPDGLDDAHAAAIANPGMSSWVALKVRAGIAPGETVLILGATGVAGQLAIQTARQLGAKRVIAAGRNVDAIAGADVDAVIALNQPEDAVRDAFAAEAASGIDVALDYLWGRPTELLLEALAKGFKVQATRKTRVIEVGASAGPTITLPAATLRSVDLTLLGSGFGAASLDAILAMIPILFAKAAAGELKIAVEPVPLAEVENAWDRAEKGRRTVFTV
ncbi:MAG TPA: zinc-binding alcohol dehydrogenase family protein [Terracidiphilus sp.]|jgi:NADPH2:quinone reductase